MYQIIEHEILPLANSIDQVEIRNYIKKILDMTDDAHYIETTGAMVSVIKKSFCHALPSMIAVRVHLSALKVDKSTKVAVLSAINGAFFHYICARQLSDDAHDWEEDMQSNRSTAVTSKILERKEDGVTLKEIFWTKCAREIATEILDHTALATRLAKKTQLLFPEINTDFLCECIARYSVSATKLIADIDQTKQFITSYEKLTS